MRPGRALRSIAVKTTRRASPHCGLSQVACGILRHSGADGVSGRQIAVRLGYRNVSNVCAACSRVEAAAESPRFVKVRTQLRERLSRQSLTKVTPSAIDSVATRC